MNARIQKAERGHYNANTRHILHNKGSNKEFVDPNSVPLRPSVTPRASSTTAGAAMSQKPTFASAYRSRRSSGRSGARYADRFNITWWDGKKIFLATVATVFVGAFAYKKFKQRKAVASNAYRPFRGGSQYPKVPLGSANYRTSSPGFSNYMSSGTDAGDAVINMLFGNSG